MAEKKKTKRIKAEKYQTEEQEEVMRFIKILIILIVIVLGVYFLTRIFVTKDLFNKDKEEDKVTAGSINYNTTIIGAMLNRPEEEYYVIMYDSEDLNNVYYSGIASNYSKNEDALKVYTIDLKNELNKKYITDNQEQVNVNTENLDSFKVKDVALLKISNKKIVKSFITEEEITKELTNKNS